ncbi:MAG TPA: potassium channel family protein [Pirellulales bacterium]|jgi:hypothetical protein|nr:potassium channel family protein [Pirellulales bacterium]
MEILGIVLSVGLIVALLVESFETIVVPRRVVHRFRYARLYYRISWQAWRKFAALFASQKQREAMLSWFGPLSLLGLFASWALGLVFAFGLLHWSIHSPLQSPGHNESLGTYLYMSGVTFFTLGYGDVCPLAGFGRTLAVAECGMGFCFLAGLISYLPLFSQAFSRREATIALLDARAGSPPSASQMLLRLAQSGNIRAIDPFLAEWERWCAELLESHLSYPLLSFYRSQHYNQSWLAALTVILDTCSFLIVGIKGSEAYQAQLTFAMARHAAVDLSLVMNVSPMPLAADRLPPDQLRGLRDQLLRAGIELHEGEMVDAQIGHLRGMYEPFVNGLAERLLFTLPAIVPAKESADNWQRSPSMPRTPGIGSLPGGAVDQTHFG